MRGQPEPARVALVTGANRGIGLEVARRLASEGLHVLLGSRDQAAGEKAARELGGDVRAVRLDVGRDEECQAAIVTAIAEFGRLDILVNNAAIYADGDATILNVPLTLAAETFDVNAIGALRLAQMAIPLMLRREWGRVVNVSSGSGQIGSLEASDPSYRLSKIAMNAITIMLADACRGSNVLVNAVCPGWVRTRMGGASAPRTPQEAAQSIAEIAMLPDGGPSGKFFRDGREIPW